MPISTDDKEITFLSGVDSTGRAASPHYQVAQKWGAAKIGTGSGSIYYRFDSPENWPEVEKSAFTRALDMWAAVANVTFVLATESADARLTFYRNVDLNGDKELDSTVGGTKPYPPPDVEDGSSEAVVITDGRIIINTVGAPIDGPPGSPGFSTLVHEIGHILGLGHGGNYNTGDDYLALQAGPYDMKLWTIMSYTEPRDSAKYADSYPITDTNWGTGPVKPATPMPLDIQAVQRLYGPPTNSPLNGGQVFGFNSNIEGSLKSIYDFAQNNPPIVTLFSTGTGNTLDASKYGIATTINLEPGSFSSTGGFTNNIAIDRNTIIETGIGGLGDDRITGNDYDNRLVGGGGDDRLIGGIGKNTLTGDGGGAFGIDGKDSFHIAGNDTITDLGAGGADILVVEPKGSVVATLADNWTATGDTVNFSEAKSATILAKGHNADLSRASVIKGAPGYTISNDGNATPVTLIGSRNQDVIIGGSGDDVLSGKGGADEINFSGKLRSILPHSNGADTVRDTLADFDGDTIVGFGTGDTIDIVGSAIERQDLAVTGDAASTTLGAGGKSFKLKGNYAAGEFVTSIQGSGADVHTLVTYRSSPSWLKPLAPWLKTWDWLLSLWRTVIRMMKWAWPRK